MTIETQILEHLVQPLCVISNIDKKIKFANKNLQSRCDAVGKISNEVFETLVVDNDNICDFAKLEYVSFYDSPDEVYQVHQSKLDNGDIILLFIKSNINKYTAKNPFLRQHDVVVDFVQNAPLPLHSITDEGIYLWANKREHELLGFEEDEDMTGLSIREFNCKKVDDHAFSKGIQTLHQGNDVREAIYSFQTRHNTVKTMAVTANSKQLENGHFYSRSILRDETERSMQNAITYSYQRSQDAQRTARSKDMLLRQIFHDIKTPLQVLSSVIITQNMFTSITEYNYFEYAKNRLIGILIDVTILIGEYTYVKNTYDPSTRMLLHDYIIKVKNVVDNELRSGQIVHFHTHIHHPHILQYIHYHPLTCRSLFHIMRNAYVYSPDHAEVHIDVDLISKRNYAYKNSAYIPSEIQATTESISGSLGYDECLHRYFHPSNTHVTTGSSMNSLSSKSFSSNDETLPNYSTHQKKVAQDGLDGLDAAADGDVEDKILEEDDDEEMKDLICVFHISNNYEHSSMNATNLKRRFMDFNELLYQDSMSVGGGDGGSTSENGLSISGGRGFGLSVVYQITKHMNGYLDCYVENNMNHFVFIVPLITLVDEYTYKDIQKKFIIQNILNSTDSHESFDDDQSLPPAVDSAVHTTTIIVASSPPPSEAALTPKRPTNRKAFSHNEERPHEKAHKVSTGTRHHNRQMNRHYQTNDGHHDLESVRSRLNYPHTLSTTIITNGSDDNTTNSQENIVNDFHNVMLLGPSCVYSHCGVGVGVGGGGALHHQHQHQPYGVTNTSYYTNIPQSITITTTDNTPRLEMSTVASSSSSVMNTVREKVKLHILVVEDSIIIQKLMTRHLLLRGHYCHSANNGQEAVDYVNSCATNNYNRCDAILMDLRMPVMDGLTALQLIRKTHSIHQLPVYIVSAETTKTIQEKASVYGANGFFGKPVNMNSIIDMLEASWSLAHDL